MSSSRPTSPDRNVRDEHIPAGAWARGWIEQPQCPAVFLHGCRGDSVSSKCGDARIRSPGGPFVGSAAWITDGELMPRYRRIRLTRGQNLRALAQSILTGVGVAAVTYAITRLMMQREPLVTNVPVAGHGTADSSDSTLAPRGGADVSARLASEAVTGRP